MATTLPCYYGVCLYFIEQQQVGEFRPLSEDIKVSAGQAVLKKSNLWKLLQAMCHNYCDFI